jgi:hypothetical protein
MEDPAKSLACSVCEHLHEEDGSCACGCEAEAQKAQLCWSCGHADHFERACKCGCEG